MLLLNAVCVSLVVIFIHITYQPGHVLEKLANWMEWNLPEKLHKPLFDCPICMTPWYGSVVLLTAMVFDKSGVGAYDVIDWIGTLFIAAGISTWYVEWKPKEEIKLNFYGDEGGDSEDF